jgi:hypothetical protein
MIRLKEYAVVASAAMVATVIAACIHDLHDRSGAAPPARASRVQVMPERALFARQEISESVPGWREAQFSSSGHDVAEHVRAVVPRALFAYFDLYLYVSKAADGAWAQHMYVFHETDDGDLAFEESFPVSTGRERQEKYFTSTPAGLFELDPDRFDRVHHSHRWNNASMPWAMFLNYIIRGNPTGVALHSAAGHAADLGHRASGGCVRLPPEKAEELFERIQSTEAGRVPVFAMDGATTDKTGRIAIDANGTPAFTQGYRVLLIIEDYPGAPAIVATIS